MRWLMIVLLVSLGALLLAAAGVARHILLQRARLSSSPGAGPIPRPVPSPALDPVEEAGDELEP